jgi:shikimate dehydrogenase
MRIFGLIGYPLSHSFSKGYFANKFQQEQIQDCHYENYPVASIAEVRQLFNQDPQLEGLNITIPYKEQVLPLLDWQNEVVSEIGACNCIRKVDGKLLGYNTDTIGFEQTLSVKLLPHHTSALILGTGGAAKAVAYVLRKLGIDFLSVSRSGNSENKKGCRYEDLGREVIESHPLIINTTPLGMYPDIESMPPLNFEWLNEKHYLYDLIYNPAKTKFLSYGETRGAAIQNGYEMLIIQAEESWRIWNDEPAGSQLKKSDADD